MYKNRKSNVSVFHAIPFKWAHWWFHLPFGCDEFIIDKIIYSCDAGVSSNFFFSSVCNITLDSHNSENSTYVRPIAYFGRFPVDNAQSNSNQISANPCAANTKRNKTQSAQVLWTLSNSVSFSKFNSLCPAARLNYVVAHNPSLPFSFWSMWCTMWKLHKYKSVIQAKLWPKEDITTQQTIWFFEFEICSSSFCFLFLVEKRKWVYVNSAQSKRRPEIGNNNVNKTGHIIFWFSCNLS